MRRVKAGKQTPRKKTAQDQEVAKILAHFYEESSAIVRAAIKESHEKHPSLFKDS